MTITGVQSGGFGQDSFNTATFNAGSAFTVGNGVIVALSVWAAGSATPLTSVVIAGTAATLMGIRDAAGDVAYVYKLDAVVNSGRSDIVVTPAFNGAYCVSGYIEASGLATGGPHQSGSATGTSAAPAATLSSPTTIADCLLIANFSNSSDGEGANTPPSGWTLLYSQNASEGGAGAYKIVSATGSQSATFATTTGGSIAWGCQILAFAGTGGGGGPPVYAPLDVPVQRQSGSSGSVARAVAIAPVGALLAAATLTSIAWANPTPITPRLLTANRPAAQAAQPIGVGNFSLTKFTQAVDLAPTRRATARAPEASAPIGALIPQALSSIGWLVIDTASPPPAPRSAIVSDGAPAGAGFTSLTTLGWLACDAPPRAALVAPRVQQTIGGESPLRPFVSASFGWGASTPLPIDAPLVARQAFESAPVGALLPGSLPSAGWQASSPTAAYQARPARDQLQSAPTGPLAPFVSQSTGWLTIPAQPRAATAIRQPDPSQAHLGGPLLFGGAPWDAPALPRQAAISSRAEISAPVGSLLQQTLPSLGWLDASTRAPALSPPRAQDPAQPSPALLPFVSASTGWLVTPLPYDTPLFGKVVADSSPTGTLLTPQPMGWAFGPDQAKPLPPVPRRADPVTPVGTPFAIALTSNGWLATDNPRTPLALGHSVPTDPVGNLLVLPPLPALTWLSTENPRTPYRATRAVPTDPVGTKIALPGALGPYWFVDLAPKAASAAARVAASDPIGSAFASLSSLGWLAPADLPRAARSRQFAFTSDPLNALQFGGAPWATVDVQPGRAAVARSPEAVAPIGSLVPINLPGFGWAPIALPPTRPATRTDAAVSSPVGSLIGAAGLTSLGWLVAVLPSSAAPRVAPAFTSDAFSALQFGGAPWTTVEPQRAALTRQAQSFDSGPFGSPFAGSLSSLGWLSVQANAPRLTPPVTVPAAPVGLLIPPLILPSMGFQSSVELPPRWHFVARPVPSEPIGSSFALGFSVAPLSRCSPLFDTTGNGRLSPIFDETR